jgi:hypothetical protein
MVDIKRLEDMNIELRYKMPENILSGFGFFRCCFSGITEV